MGFPGDGDVKWSKYMTMNPNNAGSHLESALGFCGSKNRFHYQLSKLFGRLTRTTAWKKSLLFQDKDRWQPCLSGNCKINVVYFCMLLNKSLD